MKCADTHQSGPYVLGALSSAEREEYERHLAACGACRDEVAELAVLPGLLSRIDLATVEALPPPDAPGAYDRSVAPVSGTPPVGGSASVSGVPGAPGLPGGPVTGDPRDRRQPPLAIVGHGEGGGPPRPLGDLLAAANHRRTRQRRRDRRRLAGAALAAAVLAVLAFVGVRALPQSKPADPHAGMALMQPLVEPAAVTGWIAVHPFEGGTRLTLRCTYTSGTANTHWTFRLVAVSRTGVDEPLGSWTAGYGEELRIDATTALTRSQLDRIELRSGAGMALLRYGVD